MHSAKSSFNFGYPLKPYNLSISFLKMCLLPIGLVSSLAKYCTNTRPACSAFENWSKMKNVVYQSRLFNYLKSLRSFKSFLAFSTKILEKNWRASAKVIFFIKSLHSFSLSIKYFSTFDTFGAPFYFCLPEDQFLSFLATALKSTFKGFKLANF